jgi:hypothetical protein
MLIRVNCLYCNQPFEFDNSSGIPAADCPHCGKQNTFGTPGEHAKNMTIQHDAPTLAGAKTCPSCQKQVERPAVLCVHCGYNFVTRQKIAEESWLAANRNRVVLAGGVLAVLAAAAAYLFWPEKALPPPTIAPVEVMAVAPPAPAPAAAQPAVAATPEPPPPPAGPTPEELAAQQAAAERAAHEARQAELAAERAAFEAKKLQAENTFRMQLETREPMHRLGDSVELRRKNGVLHKGELLRFAGVDTGRVAIVVTALGEIDVPIVSLDPPSRRRVDPDYREAFIRHMLSTRLADAPPPASEE